MISPFKDCKLTDLVISIGLNNSLYTLNVTLDYCIMNILISISILELRILRDNLFKVLNKLLLKVWLASKSLTILRIAADNT